MFRWRMTVTPTSAYHKREWLGTLLFGPVILTCLTRTRGFTLTQDALFLPPLCHPLSRLQDKQRIPDNEFYDPSPSDPA